MKDKKELLRQIMILLAEDDTTSADKLIQVFMDYIPEITSEEVTDVAQKLEDEKMFANAEQHSKIEQKVFQIIKEKIPVKNLSNFTAGHPINTFLQENVLIRELCHRANTLLETENSFTELYSDWTLIARQFADLDIHYLRKENQLFPFLEKRGFSHPSTIMWSIHDIIRKMARDFKTGVTGKNVTDAIKSLTLLSKEAEEMTVKEERILLPTAARLLTNEDWVALRQGEDEIGWLIAEPPKVWDIKISMDKYLKSDQARITAILNIINLFFKGAPVEDLQKQFEKELQGKITPAEFALAEQKMKDLGVDDVQFERQIEDLIRIFKKSLNKVSLNNLEEGHPLDTFIKENIAIKALLTELREKTNSIDLAIVDHEYWTEAYDKLWQVNTHYVRKENQLFPYLETKGFDKPSIVMWALHDDVRQLIKYYCSLLNDKNYSELFDTQELMFTVVEDMIFKEEKILWPTSLEMISENEWLEIRKGEDEIGYCLIERPAMWNPQWKHPSQNEKNNIESSMLQQQNITPIPFTPEGKSNSLVGGINLEVGAITPEQINLIFKHLPFDVTYVDEFNEVRYYNKGEDRVFPRSPGIIGRQVKYCHPPKSVHIVEKIVDAFKRGERDVANFWINFQHKFVYIQYFAVRDNAGNYKGVLEITYDAKTVRNLEGEQRLLDWE
ncbi:MAG: hemerythrin domain-containing protein [Bacteroidales bacterium]|nr:hemerythrin domain-containing protein [Bacteroidales bacterium]